MPEGSLPNVAAEPEHEPVPEPEAAVKHKKLPMAGAVKLMVDLPTKTALKPVVSVPAQEQPVELAKVKPAAIVAEVDTIAIAPVLEVKQEVVMAAVEAAVAVAQPVEPEGISRADLFAKAKELAMGLIQTDWHREGFGESLFHFFFPASNACLVHRYSDWHFVCSWLGAPRHLPQSLRAGDFEDDFKTVIFLSQFVINCKIEISHHQREGRPHHWLSA
jgi:hypothetical protein